jgi:type IV pilus assembly protein PilB
MTLCNLGKEESMVRKKLGELLIERGHVTQAQLDEALRQQDRTGERLGTLLVKLGYITEDTLTDVVSDRLGIPRVSLSAMVMDPQVIQ